MEIFLGQLITFELPTGMQVTIREQNGEDDAVISNTGYAKNKTSITRFIARIVQEVDGKPVRLDHTEVAQWHQQDVAYILLRSRIHSISNILKADFQCSNPDCKSKFVIEEDLNRYILGDDNDHIYAPKKYPNARAKDFVIDIAPNENVKMEIKLDHLTPQHEFDYKRTDKSITANDEILMRKPRLISKGEEIPVQNFNIFSSKMMTKIRTEAKTADPIFEIISDVTCPVCGLLHETPLAYMPDFFFPTQV